MPPRIQTAFIGWSLARRCPKVGAVQIYDLRSPSFHSNPIDPCHIKNHVRPGFGPLRFGRKFVVRRRARAGVVAGKNFD